MFWLVCHYPMTVLSIICQVEKPLSDLSTTTFLRTEEKLQSPISYSHQCWSTFPNCILAKDEIDYSTILPPMMNQDRSEQLGGSLLESEMPKASEPLNQTTGPDLIDLLELAVIDPNIEFSWSNIQSLNFPYSDES
ncbi:hypothetical protein PAAG_12682 [Paracoccidioides lutzii Pb01]|uniref:Uncharacterized protein n=1 Tax=Paracoccidioides lutzii (strain ATCC MYA-826 / Pb01) TaxID=502779 RepID=A0A0A2V3H4_PARBA|nr:hypothetical protein PAAG_12682 [Paracoccidioides lutzii Pb01]KGQ00655.1 hypothetical protein PAAG_12682 [Paracoccidioides lutzii Pb01]